MNIEEKHQSLYNTLHETNTTYQHPSPALKININNLIAQEKETILRTKRKTKIISFTSYRKLAAIAAILLAGVFIGNFWISNNHNRQINKELAYLRSQKDQTMTSTSVSTRIKAVNYSKELPSSDPSILDIIINTAQNDKNANVRLAAILALANHLNAPKVPQALGQMLLNEEDSGVKIAIIETVSAIKSKDILLSLEKLTQDESIPKYIQDEAHHGMTILQHGELF